ncbi:MAG: hypothetical protein COB32_09900 [Halomonas sp.]|nr:hypothetical protein [Halomonas sp.]PHR01763.1 MAG: hypothetical protein COB32_09900 [Halomonas sp.]
MAISFNEAYYLEQKLAQLQQAGETGFESTADVQAAFAASGLTAEQHYNQFGTAEGLNPSPEFNTDVYLNQKLAQLQADGEEGFETTADVLAAFQNAGLSPLEHYNQFGAFEAISPNNDFNAEFYLEQKLAQLQEAGETGFETTDDVLAAFQAAGLSPLDHYNQFGAFEALSPSNAFNTERYLADKLAQLQADEATAEEWAGQTTADLLASFQSAGLTPLEHFQQYGQDEGLVAQPVTPILTLADAVAAQEAGELPEVYELTDGVLTLEEAVSVADAQAALDAAQAVIANAANEEPVELNATYTLADTLENLENAPEVVAGAESYSLTDPELTAAAVEGVAVDALEDAQAAAVQAVRDNPIVAEATNGSEITVNNGTYTLLDDADAIISAIESDAVTGATSVAVTNDSITIAQHVDLQSVVDQLPEIVDTAANASGKTGLGEQAITITDAVNGPAYDFSGLQNATIDVAASVDLTTADDLGGAAIEVAEDATLTLTAQQATDLAEAGGSVTGAGAVTVTNLDGALIYDLSAINTDASVSVNTLILHPETELGGVAVVVGTSLTLTAEQANGLTITGAGSVTVTDIESGVVYDFSNIDVATNFTATIADEVTLASGSDLGTLDLAVNGSLTADAADLSGVDVTGSGTVVLTGDATDADLSNLDTGLSVDISAATGDIDPALFDTDYADLTLTAAQADGADNDSTAITIEGPFSSSAVDFSSLTNATANVESTWTVPAGSDLGTVTLAIADGVTVALNSAITGANDIDTSGEGTLRLTGSTAADLSGVTSSLNVTSYTGTPTWTGINIAEGNTLTLTVAQADAGGTAFNTITAGSMLVIGNVASGSANDADLSGITADLAFDDNSINVATGATLTLNAAQADGVTITGAGSVEVNGTADADLSAVSADLDVSGHSTGELTLPAEVASDQTLTLTADQANGLTTDGAGTVSVTTDALTADADLTDITAELSFVGTVPVDGSTLTLTAAQADGVTTSDTGSGTVVIEGLDGAAAYDLSKLAANNLTAAIDADTTLDAGTDLGDVVVDLAEGVTLTVTAAQAAGLTTADADGTVVVTGTVASQDLSGIQGTLDLTQIDAASVLNLTGLTATQVLVNVAEAAGATITGAPVLVQGTLSLTETGVDNTIAEDLTGIANLDLSEATIPADAELELADGQNLTIDASQVAQFALINQADTANATETITINGVGSTALDLSAIALNPGNVTLNVTGGTVPAFAADVTTGTVNLVIDGDTSFAGDFDFAQVDSIVVNEGATLTLTAAQATEAVTGAGTVAVTGDLASVNVSGLDSATVDLSGATNAPSTFPEGGTLDTVATLILNPAQAVGAGLEGTGTVEVNGSVSTAIDLSGLVNTSATTPPVLVADLTGITLAQGGSLVLPADDATTSLILTPELAKLAHTNTYSLSPITVEGTTSGDLNLIDIDADLDISGLTVEGELYLPGGVLGGVDASLASGQALTLTAAQASGQDIEGAGDASVVIKSLDGSAAYDLSEIATEITAPTVTAAIAEDTVLDAGTVLGAVALTVAADTTLTLTAAQASGATITGDGNVVVNGLAENTVLTGINVNGDLTVNVDASVELVAGATLSDSDSDPVLNLADGVTLTSPASEVEGLTINGAGELVITAGMASQAINGDAAVTVLDPATSANLSSIALGTDSDRQVTVEFTADADFATSGTMPNNGENVSVVVADGVQVEFTAAQLDGFTVTGAGSVLVSGAASSEDLSGIATDIEIDPAATNVTSLTFPTLAAGQTVTGTATVLSTAEIAGDGTINVTGLAANPAGLAANLSGLTAASVTAEFDGTGTFTGNLGNAVVTVTAGNILTADAAILDGATIEGEGGVTVTGTTADIDLSNVTATGNVMLTTANYLDLRDNATLGNVDAYNVTGGNLFLTVDQADGAAFNNSGNVVITGTANGADFSGLDGNVDLTAVEGDFALPAQLASGDTLTVTAAQVNGKSIVVPTGATLEIVDLHETPNADLSGLESTGGTITAHFDLRDVTSDEVNFTGQLGAGVIVNVGLGATLIADVAIASGQAIQGDGTFVATGSITDGDFSAVTTNLDLSGAQLDGITILPGNGTLGGSQTLTIDVNEVGGEFISGGSIVAVGEITDGNFAGISSNLDLSDVTLSGITVLPSMTGQTLTLADASLIDGETITGSGAIVIEGDANGVEFDTETSLTVNGDVLNATFTNVEGDLTIVGDASGVDFTNVTGGTNQTFDFSEATLSANTLLPGQLGNNVTVDTGDTLVLGINDQVGRFFQGGGELELTGELQSDLDLTSNQFGVTTLTLTDISVADGVTLTLDATQADGETFGGEGQLNVREDDGNTTPDTYSVDLGEAVKATIEFSDLEDDWNITGANQDDVLDFSLIAASETTGLSSTNFQQYVKGAAIDAGFLAIATDLVVDTTGGADTVADVAAFFAQDGFAGLGADINGSLAANSKMIFALSDSADEAGSSQLWYWNDVDAGGTPGDGIVQSGELTNIGTLTDINGVELAGLTADNVDLIA